MVIYIEQILIDNFVINFFILLSLKGVLKAKIKKLNIVLSSLLGSVISLCYPLFLNIFWFSICLKILLSLVMVLMLKKWQKPKEFVLYYLTFLLLTCLFGGVCLFLLVMFDKNFSPSNYSSYSLPLGVICVIVFFVFLVVKNIFKNFYKRKNVNNFVYKIVLENNGNFDEILGFLDSGNNLVDNITKKPITIVDFFSLKNLTKEVNLADIVLNKQGNINKVFKNAHTIETLSIGKNVNKILVIQIDKLEIYNDNSVHIINDAIIGLTLKSFVSDIGYSALLNKNLM